MKRWKIGLICGILFAILGMVLDICSFDYNLIFWIPIMFLFLISGATSLSASLIFDFFIAFLFYSSVGFIIGYLIDRHGVKDKEGVISSMDKETIKQFLKPTKWKIITFLGLMTILLLAFLILDLAPMDSIIIVFLYAYILFPVFLGSAFLGGQCCPDCGPCSGFQAIGGIIIYYFLCYIISCLIIFVYNKFKTKK